MVAIISIFLFKFPVFGHESDVFQDFVVGPDGQSVIKVSVCDRVVVNIEVFIADADFERLDHLIGNADNPCRFFIGLVVGIILFSINSGKVFAIKRKAGD